MDLLEAINRRHSVRSFIDKKIEGDVEAQLRALITECNNESELNMQLCVDEPNAFSGMMARYGKFTNVKNYLALVGRKGPDLEEKCGYYGEKIVLLAQQLGLNSCWVAVSFSKSKSSAVVNSGEKLLMVIALGYGETHGIAHKVKPLDDLCLVDGPMPHWFRDGMEAAQLAPTATNQQKFRLTLEGDKVKAESLGGFYSKTDLGIVKYHFEVGAGQASWSWKD